MSERLLHLPVEFHLEAVQMDSSNSCVYYPVFDMVLSMHGFYLACPPAFQQGSVFAYKL